MADPVEYPGRLVAVDGTREKDLSAAARALVAALKERRLDCAISRFDASGLFGELAAAGRRDRHVSPRTLALVYAADLAFRLRWEIRPVLEAGGIVIAAPYLDAAAAIGAAHGLDQEWIGELMRFAPRPHFRGRPEEKKLEKGWKARVNRGYGEYCAAMLPPSDSARQRSMALLDQRRGRKIYRLVDDGVDDLVNAIMGSQRAPRSRSASQPRIGRK
jgi:hypothetical protein